MKPLKIDEQTAKGIIENRNYKGLFYFEDGSYFIGVDNSAGEAFTEEFKTEKECLNWLNKYGQYYEVVIVERLVKPVSVVAYSEDEAISKVERLYDKAHYVLDYDDFSTVDFLIDE